MSQVGVSAESEVPDQPIGDEETKLGAKNRAKAALAAVGSRSSLSMSILNQV